MWTKLQAPMEKQWRHWQSKTIGGHGFVHTGLLHRGTPALEALRNLILPYRSASSWLYMFKPIQGKCSKQIALHTGDVMFRMWLLCQRQLIVQFVERSCEWCCLFRMPTRYGWDNKGHLCTKVLRDITSSQLCIVSFVRTVFNLLLK